MTIHEIVLAQRAYFNQGKTKTYESRRNALLTLKKSIIKYEKEIMDALYQDLNKSEFETYMTEVGVVLSEIEYHLKHLKKWMKPKRVKTPLSLFHAKSYIYAEPYGVSLIMSPWNYPFQLAIDPLVGAISAGNTAIIKPGNYAHYTSLIIQKIISESFEPEFVTVILGGREENQLLLEEHFDYIFFTGSTFVGKIVMEKASKYLTPISLELGGKSPCIIDQSTNYQLAAKRIAFGKCLNAGQTCVAPDYLLLPKGDKEKFVEEYRKAILEFYGENPLEANHYPKIINQHHLHRLQDLIKDEQILLGGKSNESKIEPTLLGNITLESKIMQEEIFGPILPIIEVESIEEAIQLIKTKAKPLALYLFTKNIEIEKKVFDQISFGGATVNDTIMHFASTEMGFGGVGDSGMGKYHGKFSFDTFSNHRGVVKRSNIVDLPFRYHPVSKQKEKFIKRFLK